MSSTDETFGHSHHPDPTTSAAEPASLRRRREVTHRAGRAEATAASADAETLTRELQQLQSVTDTALAHLALPDLLAELLVRLRSLVEVDDVAILLPEEDGQHLQLQAACGRSEANVGQLRFPIGQGVTGRIAATRSPMAVDDLASVEAVYPTIRKVYRSVVGVPMLVEERLVGVVCASSTTLRHFTEAEVQLLQKAADRMALAIDRAQLYQAEQQAHQQLDRIFEHIADGVVVYNTQGQLLRLNAVARRILGLDAASAEYAQLPITERAVLFEMYDEQDRPIAPEDMPTLRVLRGQVAEATNREVRLRTLDGRDVACSMSAAPLRDEEGHLTGVVTVLHDQTEQKRLARAR